MLADALLLFRSEVSSSLLSPLPLLLLGLGLGLLRKKKCKEGRILGKGVEDHDGAFVINNNSMYVHMYICMDYC